MTQGEGIAVEPTVWKETHDFLRSHPAGLSRRALTIQMMINRPMVPTAVSEHDRNWHRVTRSMELWR